MLLWIIAGLLLLIIFFMSGLSSRITTLEEQIADCVHVYDAKHHRDAQEMFVSPAST